VDVSHGEHLKLAVASGKGGTGKTTVATNLALSLENILLLDCDVEEPDSQIFLKMNLKKCEDVCIPVPKIDENKCNFCGKCSDFCQYNAIAVVPDKILVFPELCHGCGGCSLVCPEDAISEEPRVIGVIEGGKSNNLEFFQGLLNIGEPMATPLVATVKKKINKNKTAIIDCPPGTSCPVIESIKDADFCVLVTEPTPFGLYDLKLAVGMVQALNVPFGVLINQDGVGNDEVAKFCKENKIPILMKIPHDRNIAHLYSKGIAFVKDMPEWKDEFQTLFQNIKEFVENNKE
jgi:MinD superfamily P-loop ATPase